MRARLAAERRFFDPEYSEHPKGQQLARISEELKRHPEFLEWIADDLGAGDSKRRGRPGIPCDTVLRCALLKQLFQVGYRELEYFLTEMDSAKRFARTDTLRPPKRSALQRTISAVSAGTWQRINRALLGGARNNGVEDGSKVRVDSTVTETNILLPADSQLLADAVRVLSRLLGRALGRLGPDAFPFQDHTRSAKNRAFAISKARGDNRRKLYRKQLATALRTLRYAVRALDAVDGRDDEWTAQWRSEVSRYLGLAKRVVDQTRRRVVLGERVPAAEKVVSLFEDHTDIIAKGGRKVHYGHKLNLCSGASGLVTDVVVEDGNPADAARCIPMLERHAEVFGSAPDQAAFDGGYASRDNLEAARDLGVKDVVFHRKRGIKPDDMASSPRTYRLLRNFRAGMEAVVSYLKRCFGLGRCLWRGIEHFRAYVWLSVVSHNLLVMARRSPA